ncbi:hypothetical protein AMECASPLE_037349 [Ameca splendens]|uniref:Uncharacterized protein n=1 Tax=Ameca splendens TaxID=208324 RepID=A0ABV0Y7X8_9TELE
MWAQLAFFLMHSDELQMLSVCLRLLTCSLGIAAKRDLISVFLSLHSAGKESTSEAVGETLHVHIIQSIQTKRGKSDAHSKMITRAQMVTRKNVGQPFGEGHQHVRDRELDQLTNLAKQCIAVTSERVLGI